jgi:hypothetical protein
VLFDRRGVLVGEQREVGADAGAERRELQGEVEPPAWVAVSEEIISMAALNRPAAMPPLVWRTTWPLRS